MFLNFYQLSLSVSPSHLLTVPMELGNVPDFRGKRTKQNAVLREGGLLKSKGIGSVVSPRIQGSFTWGCCLQIPNIQESQ